MSSSSSCSCWCLLRHCALFSAFATVRCTSTYTHLDKSTNHSVAILNTRPPAEGSTSFLRCSGDTGCKGGSLIGWMDGAEVRQRWLGRAGRMGASRHAAHKQANTQQHA